MTIFDDIALIWYPTNLHEYPHILYAHKLYYTVSTLHLLKFQWLMGSDRQAHNVAKRIVAPRSSKVIDFGTNRKRV